jgi:hypothetical protein
MLTQMHRHIRIHITHYLRLRVVPLEVGLAELVLLLQLLVLSHDLDELHV